MIPKPIIRKADEVQAQDVANSKAATIQILLGPEDGMPNFFTRRFTIRAGGEIPNHKHDVLEHEQMVVSGKMVLTLDGREHLVSEGDCIYIPAGVAHRYENRFGQDVQFLCMVPAVDDYKTEWLSASAGR